MAKKTQTNTITVVEQDNSGMILAEMNDQSPLSTQRELFCQLYVNKSDFFGNATLCYAAAYGIDLDQKKAAAKKKAYNVAQAAGSRLLLNVMVRARINQLLNEMMKDEVVDAELAKVILQDYKLDQKVNAIREYNKVKGRVKPPQANNFFQLNIQELRDEYA